MTDSGSAPFTPLDDLLPAEQEFQPPMQQPQPPMQQQQQHHQQQAPMQYAPLQAHAPQQPAAAAAQPSMYQTVLDMATNTTFLKTVLVAAAIVLAVLLFPVEDYVIKYAPFFEKVPHAAHVIKALAAGLAVTLIRPPQI